MNSLFRRRIITKEQMRRLTKKVLNYEFSDGKDARNEVMHLPLEQQEKLYLYMWNSKNKSYRAFVWKRLMDSENLWQSETLKTLKGNIEKLRKEFDFDHCNMYQMKPYKTKRLKISIMSDQEIIDFSNQFYAENNCYLDISLRNIRNFVISLRTFAGDMVGCILLCKNSLCKEKSFEIGYYIRKKYRNQGYCKEAVKSIIDKLFSYKLNYVYEDRSYMFLVKTHNVKVDILYLSAVVDNKISNHIAKTLGFNLIGTYPHIEDNKLEYNNIYYLMNNRKI